LGICGVGRASQQLKRNNCEAVESIIASNEIRGEKERKKTPQLRMQLNFEMLNLCDVLTQTTRVTQAKQNPSKAP